VTVSITYDSVALPNPAPLEPKVSANSFEIEIECFTNDYSVVETFQAKTGIAKAYGLASCKVKIQIDGGAKKASLVISGVNTDLDGTYTNCVIMEPFQAKEQGGTAGTWWKFKLKFQQDTSA